MTSCPWNIYAEQLLPLGYGHPLWYPEPVGGREILIGDVGWFRTNGQFTPLFNVKSSREGPVNQQIGVPRGFTVFDSPGSSSRTVFTNPNSIMQRSLCSRTVQTREVEAELSAGSGDIAASGSFAFQTTADCGALVLLEPPAESADIESKRHIVNYMRRHFDSWLDFVNGQEGMGLGLEEQDILFVSGTTKTTHWGVAAFQGNGSERKEGRISAQFTPYATASFSVSLAHASMPRSHYRYGPHPGQEASVPVTMSMLSQEVQPGLTAIKRDQCLFIHYYKMRRRRPLPKFAMRAAAGPHDLGPGSSDPGTSDSASIVSGSPSPDFVLDTLPDAEMLVDPVDHLLKYILDHSNAQMAVASDQDVIALLTDLSGDVYEGILHAAPEIEIDDLGGWSMLVSESGMNVWFF
ncbi:hypothetical protein BD311DRAFT_807886 [Dichomitus squalens]|uniref:Uncharacterized protein n=1 Tax=Dichomitus squalens TaxID=114155 RepID=A0A4Q9MI72_9APHY|nr:hypothetical protein BD311DRAFT_807886 [Dichomitus squalens]